MVSKLKIRKRFFLPPPKTEGIPKFDGGGDPGIGQFSHVIQQLAGRDALRVVIARVPAKLEHPPASSPRCFSVMGSA